MKDRIKRCVQHYPSLRRAIYLALALRRAQISPQFLFKVLRGKVGAEFIDLLIEKHRLSRASLKMSLYVTSRCQLNCEHCIMMNLMKQHRSYEMSLDEIETLIRVSEARGYSFDFVLTGGEPLIWRNLKQAMKLLRSSPICNSIVIFSNAMSTKQVDEELLSNIDSLRLSLYSDNEQEARALVEAFGDKVHIEQVDRTLFYPNPAEPVPESLPVECLNPELLLYNYQVFACPHSRSIAIAAESSAKIAAPLEGAFLREMSGIKAGVEKQQDICSMCISNAAVRRQLDKVANLSHQELAKLRKQAKQQAESAANRLPIVP